MLRWSLADGGDPYALAAAEVARHPQAPPPAPPFTGGAVGFFGYDCVRTVEPLGEPNPDVLGLPDMALMLSDVLLAFDHLKHTVTVLANATSTRREARPRASRTCASAWPGRCRAPSARRAPSRLRAQHAPRAVRGDGRAHRRVRPRRRRLPGRAVAALVGAGAGRAVLDLPRPARRQPVAVHVLPRLRGLPDRRRQARAAASPSPAAASRRARSPARARAARRRRGRRASPRSCSPTRRSAPST